MSRASNIASGFLSKAGGMASSIALNSVLNSPIVAANYAANHIAPIIIPTGGELLNALNHGFIDFDSANEYLKFNGINIDRPCWSAILDLGKLYPSIDDTLKAYWRGQINQQVYDRWIAHNGATDRTVRDFVSHKPFNWSPELVRILYRVGVVDSIDKYQDWLRASGLILEEDRRAFESLYTPPTLDDVMSMWNRGYLNETAVDLWLSLLGFTQPEVVRNLKRMRHKIPSPSELIDFSVKEVWNEEVVQKFGYDDEYNEIPQFKAWMNQQGYGGNPNAAGVPSSSLTEWSQAFWRKHWRVISNEQAYRMLHRLRPTGGPNGASRVPVVPGTNTPVAPVTISDVNTILKINDYPPYWRDKLAALSFNVLRLIDIRRIVRRSLDDSDFKNDAIGPGFSIKTWAVENFLDRGQTPADATALAELAIADATEQLARPAKARIASANGRMFRAILSQYKTGTIERQTALNRLAGVGWFAPASPTLLDAIDIEVQLDCVKANIRNVKKAFTKGTIDEQKANEILEFYGITPLRSAQYINCWKAGMTAEHVIETTQEVQEALSQGLITPQTAANQLANLGWQNFAELLQLQEIASELNSMA